LNDQLYHEMSTYYDERAEEYDQVYEGKEPAIQRYSNEYVDDVAEISRMVAGFGHGGSLGVCMVGIAESRTCSGSSRVAPNKLGNPTP